MPVGLFCRRGKHREAGREEPLKKERHVDMTRWLLLNQKSLFTQFGERGVGILLAGDAGRGI
jgi:hypothetical protein